MSLQLKKRDPIGDFFGGIGGFLGDVGNNVSHAVSPVVQNIGHFIDPVASTVRNNPVLNIAAMSNPITMLPALINNARNVPQQTRDLGAGVVDTANFVTRIPQTIDTAANVFNVNTIDNLPGMERQRQIDIIKGRALSQSYDVTQKHLQELSDIISGQKGTTNADTTREANDISRGKGTPGEVFSAAIKSVNAASLLPVSRAVGGGLTRQTGPRVTLKDRQTATLLDKNPDVTTKVTPKGVARAREQNDINKSYQQAQAERENRLKQNPVINALQVAQRELADPRAVQQRLDNQWFSYLKSIGKTKKGQTELLSSQSLAHQRGMIENPGKPAAVRASTSYSGSGDTLNSINKFYGHSEKPKARAFENYRIFKDELENMASGKPNTLGLDPNEMARYVSDYEKSNPLAARHNAELRANQLAGFKESTEAGIEHPDVFKTTSGRQFYNPRKAVDPEGLVRPKVTGGMRSNPSSIKLRSETAGGPVRSPLDIFYKQNLNIEKKLAEQRYGLIMRERVAAGKVKGAEEIVNADTTVRHKALLRDVEDLREAIKSARKERDAIKKELKSTKNGASKNKAVARKAELKVVSLMKDLLKKSKGNKESVYNDLVDRDPRHGVETAAVHERYDSAVNTAIANKDTLAANTLKTARQNALDTLDKKYPQPTKYTDKQLLDLANSLGLNGKGTVTKKLTGQLAQESEKLKAMLRDSRDYIKGVEDQKSATFSEYADTTQHEQRGSQTVNYKVAGETGKIDVPASIAKELDASAKASEGSLVEKGLQTLSGAQKAFWTNPIVAPVFQVINTFFKNPTLAFFNGDRLSGVGFHAIGAFFRASLRTPRMVEFRQVMKKGGASYENALKTRNIQSTVANDIAARANLKTFFARNPVHTLQDLWKGLSTGLTHFSNAQRDAVAYGAKQRALRLGFNEKEATDMAVSASAKVFGDFDRISRLARDLEIVFPYSGATQAGGRAMGHAWRTKPVETAFKAAAFTGTVGALTAWGISNNDQYHTDMINQNKKYLLDNNITVVLPGASKNDKGEWSGVVTVPLVPDLRPLNRATWQSVHSAVNGEGVDAKMIAGELFNQFTQDTANSLYDSSVTDNGKNPLNGVLSNSPVTATVKIGAGVNPQNGNPLASDYQHSLHGDEQVNSNTSDAAIAMSKATEGVITPLQVDAYLGRLGNLGKGIKSPDNKDGTKSNFLDNFLNFAKPFEPGTSQPVSKQEGQKYYENLITALTPLNENERSAFTSLHPKSKDDSGEQVYTSDSTYNPAARLDIYNRFPKVFRADKELNDKAAAEGKPNNPLFELTSKQVKKVLEHDNLPPGAKDPELSHLYNQEWYSQYAVDKTKFFDDVSKSQSASLAQAQKEGDKEKVASLEKSIKKFNSPSNPYPQTSAQLQRVMDTYSSLPKGTGARSAWIRNNPQAWSAMQNQFASIDNWQNIQRGKRGLAKTEGAEGAANGFTAYTQSSGGGYGGGSGGGSNSSANKYKYSVALNAGGSAPAVIKSKAKVGELRKNKVVAKTGKPKVSIKKALT